MVFFFIFLMIPSDSLTQPYRRHLTMLHKNQNERRKIDVKTQEEIKWKNIFDTH